MQLSIPDRDLLALRPSQEMLYDPGQELGKTSHRACCHILEDYRSAEPTLVMCCIDGKDIKDINRGFEPACKRADHTAATWLIQRRMPVWQAAGLAMSEKMLRDVYGHHHFDSPKEPADTSAAVQNKLDGFSRNVRVIV